MSKRKSPKRNISNDPPPDPTPPNKPKWALDRLDNDYDLYSRREIHNERHRRGIAWDDYR